MKISGALARIKFLNVFKILLTFSIQYLNQIPEEDIFYKEIKEREMFQLHTFEMNLVSYLKMIGDSIPYTKLWLAVPDLGVFKTACFYELLGVRGAPSGMCCL